MKTEVHVHVKQNNVLVKVHSINCLEHQVSHFKLSDLSHLGQEMNVIIAKVPI